MAELAALLGQLRLQSFSDVGDVQFDILASHAVRNEPFISGPVLALDALAAALLADRLAANGVLLVTRTNVWTCRLSTTGATMGTPLSSVTFNPAVWLIALTMVSTWILT